MAVDRVARKDELDGEGRGTLAPIGWAASHAPVPYEAAVAAMEQRVAAIAAGTACELVWLLQHPPLYTAGTSAKPQDLLTPDRFPVHRTGRGGQYTYHGPGQRVVYVMLDVRRRTGDVKAFVHGLEAWVIDALADLGIVGEARCDRVGVWVRRPERGAGVEDKVAAIGIRLRRWISLHGLAINVTPDLEHFSGIVPCGIAGHGVTSLEDLAVSSGVEARPGATRSPSALMQRCDAALRAAFERRFGPVTEMPAPPLEAAG